MAKLIMSTLSVLVLFTTSCTNHDRVQTHESGVINTSNSKYVKLRSIPMQDTRLTEGFWAERFELCANKMIPAMEKAMLGKGSAKLGRIKFMAGLSDENPGGVPWGDGDNYKWLETMAHVYNINKDPELDAKMDEWISVIAKAQEEDGYISTNIGHDKENRFGRVNAHEMYNMGHLLTAACIHYRVTGKENFLDIGRKNADFQYRQWKAEPQKMARFPWNPSVFMGLAEMYRTTGDQRYLELLQIMIDNRGSRPNPDRDHRYGGTDQTQDRVPLRKETIAIGHAVTGNYYYCGAADLYAETGEQAILDALMRIWEDQFEKKIDITCGAAAIGFYDTSPRGDELHESFASEPFLQPNHYNETCANIGSGMLNYRLLGITGEAKYADWTERMMYNAINAGVDLKGEKWFYCNPLSWDGEPGDLVLSPGNDSIVKTTGHHTGLRWETNNCYCCPPSVARTTAKIHNWFYNISDDGGLWVNFYGGSKLSTNLADGSFISLTQSTDYPWDGKIEIQINEASRKEIPFHFRIPEWTENPSIFINDEMIDDIVQPGSYFKIQRKWSEGDVLIIDFPMPVRLVEANPKAENLRNKVAVMRGPVLYCLELPREENGEQIRKNGVFLPPNINLKPEFKKDFLGGVTVLKGMALTREGSEQFIMDNPGGRKPLAREDGTLYQFVDPREYQIPEKGAIEIELIPYYAWANRGLAYMDVWIPLTVKENLGS